jgi:hypothetical protein
MPNYFYIFKIFQHVLTIFSDEIIEELHKKLPNIRLICQFLNYENISTNAIHSIVERFRLNDEILAIAFPLLCRRASENFDDRLVSLFAFYSAAERNENLRFIALDSLKQLHSDYFKLIPESIFSLIVDDDEEIRLGICKVLNASNPLCPAESLRRFIGQVGTTEFIKFLDNYQKKHSCHEDSHLKLFEKEPLNLFIDVQFLRKKLCSL